MILRCLVVTITRNRKGEPIRSGKVVAGDPITIGRGAENSIFLPDPRVHLDHGIIRNDDLGKLHVEAQAAPIDVNGELHSRAKLRRGARILIGPYQIIPEPPSGPDHDFGLAVELVQPLPPDLNDLRNLSQTSLGATWLSKRGMAWALFALVGSLSLALPVAYATSPGFREEAIRRFPESLKRVAWDTAWDPGALSSGHQSLSQRCEACHETPFERVQDRACITCHATTGQHLKAASSQIEANLGAPCAECHRDHRGESPIVATDSKSCVGCHSDLKNRFPTSTLLPVTDFAVDHPPLALSVLNASTTQTERVPQDQWKSHRENSGLKFPHAIHLAESGLRSPNGIRVLRCASCHEADAGRVGFEPVTMDAHCSECHSLAFEPALTSRRAPHGNPDAIVTMLLEFYSRIALGERPVDVTLVNGLLRRPIEGKRVDGGSGLAWANRKAQAVAVELIETRVCVQCHIVSRLPEDARPGLGSALGPGWLIEPVAITSEWLAGPTAFNHKSHQQAACETCHDVRASGSSADIAMPTLAVCQSCHAGAVAVKGKVRSTCQTCHSFHQNTAPPSALSAEAHRSSRIEAPAPPGTSRW